MAGGATSTGGEGGGVRVGQPALRVVVEQGGAASTGWVGGGSSGAASTKGGGDQTALGVSG